MRFDGSEDLAQASSMIVEVILNRLVTIEDNALFLCDLNSVVFKTLQSPMFDTKATTSHKVPAH